MSWYPDDPAGWAAMAADDRRLQKIYRRVRAGLPADARRRTRGVHAYPSRRCTYTLSKERIFVRVRDAVTGAPAPECVVRYVLLHELAHVLNPTRGHDDGFRGQMRRLLPPPPLLPLGGRRGMPCPDRVPADFNPCH